MNHPIGNNLPTQNLSSESDGRANEVDDEMGGKLKEKCLERRVIGDRCDRYGRSGVRGIRSGKAKPTKLGSA